MKRTLLEYWLKSLFFSLAVLRSEWDDRKTWRFVWFSGLSAATEGREGRGMVSIKAKEDCRSKAYKISWTCIGMNGLRNIHVDNIAQRCPPLAHTNSAASLHTIPSPWIYVFFIDVICLWRHCVQRSLECETCTVRPGKLLFHTFSSCVSFSGFTAVTLVVLQ